MTGSMTGLAGARPASPCYDGFDTVCKWAENPDRVLKAGSTFIDLINNLGCLADDSNLPIISNGLKEAKAVLAPTAFMKTLNDVRHETYGWLTGEKGKGLDSITRKVLDFVSPIWDVTDLLAKKIVSIPAQCLNGFKGIHGVVLAVKFAWDSISKSLPILQTNDGSLKVKLEFLKMVNQISLVALGVMTALTCFYGMVFPPLAYSAFSVISVVFSFGVFFIENNGKIKTIE